jgi:hypothetical protein
MDLYGIGKLVDIWEFMRWVTGLRWGVVNGVWGDVRHYMFMTNSGILHEGGFSGCKKQLPHERS